MKYHEFGKENETTLLLLHGMCSTWEMSFKPLIDLAQKDYHIIAVAIDGYNPDQKELDATTTQHESDQIAQYLADHFGGHIDIVYGASMGGVYTLELLADDRISFDTVIIDGLSIIRMPEFLSSDTKTKLARFFSNVLYRIMTKHQSLIVKVLGLGSVEELQKMMYTETSKTTLFNTMNYMYAYHWDFAHLQGQNAHIWSGSDEKNTLKTVKGIQTVCSDVKIKIFENCGHGSLLLQPERLLREIELAHNAK